MERLELNFASDNAAPASPEVVEAVTAANRGAAGSYGADELTARLDRLARELFETDEVAVFPVTTGSAANGLALAALTPPFGAVYCHDHAHVMVDECGAPEFFTAGAKLIGLPSPDGKLRPGQLEAPLAEARAMGVHHVRPAAVSITQATEWGTVYRPAEIGALAETARAHGLGLHMDGARFANAVAALDCAPADLTWRAGVQALALGATKNGGLAAEALVLFDRKLAADSAYRRKRSGHLWSKMRFISAQLVALFENGLWLRNARHANRMAARLAAGLADLPGIGLAQPVEANEIFATMPERVAEGLQAAGFQFYGWSPAPGAEVPTFRLVTSFATEPAAVDGFLSAARDLASA